MRRYLITVDGREFDISLDPSMQSGRLLCNGRPREIITHLLGPSRALVLIDNESLEVDVRANAYDTKKTLFVHGMEIPVTIEDYHLAQLRKTAGIRSGAEIDRVLRAAMPGLVLEVKVRPGEIVRRSQPLLIIEAMKMENIIKAQGEGTVKTVFVAPGKSVEKNDKLLEFA
ncbi:MAG TPA: hypothetical protein PKM94_12620 [candidate division Zixibacteria bacterium]|nr:hypothetical protein [candidate division Zixibacteria bacterium]MDD4916256.1 hypothetical protein [candidate division Zixibacteria bacterium]MDM7973146.1 biotin/lipoyl-containing protein [candidate division Zixibacteria bacterium]HOD67518.1 hypothetical protein [candidate division Zixibacteria bacterium]HPC11421.1 hypothetical protein [candidate division Zixibacteria bacterium]